MYSAFGVESPEIWYVLYRNASLIDSLRAKLNTDQMSSAVGAPLSPTVPRTSGAPTISKHSQRANTKRRALRDFYGLDRVGRTVNQDDIIDATDFSASATFSDLCQTSSTKDLLKLENDLVKGQCVLKSFSYLQWLEIRTLDGEKKALVYDNYGKVLSAMSILQSVNCHFTC